ncbi:MAG TPA: glutamyl-tRNA reductase, partial [Verrucomicrobiales bacterium]|nr:glutamyl-tRNA reductase [Verrucomicrobiales bacterium]
LARLRSAGLAREAVLISTCNRVELYAVTDHPLTEAERSLRCFLSADRAVVTSPDLGWYIHGEEAGVVHLFRVASGLDSLVLGETEILGQIKQAYHVALQNGHTGRVLNKLFQAAFSTAKRVRSETQIQRGNTSVASVAVELAEKIFDGLRGREVMVIGAGDTSEKTARALVSRGARSVLVSNRSFARAASLAEELGGRAIHFDDWEREFSRLDIIVSSTSAPHFILDRARLAALLHHRAARPLLLIDLAVPRDMDPDVKQLDNVFLANVDDLQAIADEHLRSRREEQIRCEAIIRERVCAWTGQFSPPPPSADRLAFE